MAETRKKIGELLIEAGLITPAQLAEGLARQQRHGAKIVENLLALNYISMQQMGDFLANFPGIASVELSNYELPEELLRLIPVEFAREHEVIPLDRMGNHLTVVMAFPLDQNSITAMEQLTGCTVRPLLCSQKDIRAALDFYYREDAEGRPLEASKAEYLTASLRLGSIPTLIRHIDKLPSLPDTVQKVQEALSDQDVSIQCVLQVLRRDPPVVAKLLAVANSAALAMPYPVDTLEMALSVLGLRDTYSIVISAVAPSLFDSGQNRALAHFWSESQQCAHAAVAIAKARGFRQTPKVFAAALLHDIGKLVLNTLAPEKYQGVQATLVGEELIQEEETQFGLAHPEAGYLLAEAWNLPVELTQTIRYHHNLSAAPEHRELVANVQLAGRLVHCRDVAELEDQREALQESMEVLRLRPELLPVLRDVIGGFTPENN